MLLSDSDIEDVQRVVYLLICNYLKENTCSNNNVSDDIVEDTDDDTESW